MRGKALALAALLLAGCDEPAPANRAAAPQPAATAAPAAPGDQQAAALRATEERLRARLRSDGPLTQRAVVVHRQAMAGTLAVCGQVNASGRGDDPFIPYVAVIAFEGEQAARVDFHLAASSPEATRVYLEMVDRCWDGGGPASARVAGRALPPVPSSLPRSLPPEPARAPTLATAPAASAPTPTTPTAATPVAPAPAAVAGMVTTSARTPVNVREAPSGGTAVLRVVPRGSTLQVFGEAPGGWLQVGEAGEPWGWLHSSMLEGR
jgi:hypothetical protein